MASKHILSGNSISLPIFSAEPTDGERFIVSGDILGTAFRLPNTYMLTAGHVVREIQSLGDMAGVVGISDSDGFFKAAPIRQTELLPCDIGLIEVEFIHPESSGWAQVLRWEPENLNFFTPVRTLGYPYGMHKVGTSLSSVQRGFQGHIVSRLLEYQPIGSIQKPFSVYELSFAAPRGLSGAPLINTIGMFANHGIVIGNSKSKMLVASSTERHTELSETTIVERYDTLSLGIAVTAEMILALESKILGTSVGEFVRENL